MNSSRKAECAKVEAGGDDGGDVTYTLEVLDHATANGCFTRATDGEPEHSKQQWQQPNASVHELRIEAH